MTEGGCSTRCSTTGRDHGSGIILVKVCKENRDADATGEGMEIKLAKEDEEGEGWQVIGYGECVAGSYLMLFISVALASEETGVPVEDAW